MSPCSIVISALFYYKEEIAEDFVFSLQPQMNYAADALGCEVNLVITLNFPYTAELWDSIEARFNTPDSTIKIKTLRRGYNLGFGASHNHVFESTASDVFIVQNNDLFCSRNEWIAEIGERLLEPAGPDLIGVIENMTALRDSDACGIPPSKSRPADFADGSLFGVRSKSAQRLGLFSKDFQYFYFEDADFFLRYKQAGAAIDNISVPHSHIRWSGSRQIPRHAVECILDLNRGAFFKKWGRYIQSRSLTNSVLVDFSALVGDQVLLALPACCGLSVDHPTAKLHIVLPNKADHLLFQHRNWVIREKPPEYQADFDRVWIASKVGAEDMPAMATFLKDAGCSFYPDIVSRHLRSLMNYHLSKTTVGKQIATFFVSASSRNHQGVYPTKDFFAPVARQLEERGLAVDWCDIREYTSEGSGEVAAGASLQALLQRLSDSVVVVTAADRIGILAQLLGCKTAIVFGARLPQGYVLNWDIVTCFANTELECLGCQNIWGTTLKSFCLRRDEACISAGLGESFANQLREWFDDPRKQPLQQCSQAYSRTLSFNRRRSAELDLSSWPE
jgi:hypothetical protein